MDDDVIETPAEDEAPVELVEEPEPAPEPAPEPVVEAKPYKTALGPGAKE